MMTTQLLCRLCLEDAVAVIDIHSELGEISVNEIISQHFWFDIKQDDTISNKICTNCWTKTAEFHNFYNKIQTAQSRITIVFENQLKILGEKHDSNEMLIQNVIEDIEEDDRDYQNIKVEPQAEVDVQLKPSFEETNVSDTGERNLAKIIVNEYEISSVEENPAIIKEKRPKTVFRKSRRKRTVKCTSNNPSSSNDSDNSNMSICINAIVDFPSENEEYNDEQKPKREKRKPVKKELIEAAKEQEQKLIESYYKMNCEICRSKFNHLEPLFEHYQSDHCIRGFILCCGKKFHRRPVIADHVLWHTNPDLFKCKICNKIYADKRCLSNHLLAHAPSDMKLFKCDRCPKSFVKKFKLDQHKLSHLTPEEKKYICDECEKPYASDSLLRAHKRVVHEKTYAHMCEICAKVFKSRVFFEKHQLEHLGQNLPRVQCHICSSWMKNEHTMRAHMRLHEDAGIIHKCDVCGKQGPSRNAILKHKRFVHLSERKFKCTLCDKAFKRAITLKEHMTVHTGEVLYTCTFCPKTFNSGANMHAHRKKSHPVEWEEEKKIKQLSMKPELCLN